MRENIKSPAKLDSIEATNDASKENVYENTVAAGPQKNRRTSIIEKDIETKVWKINNFISIISLFMIINLLKVLVLKLEIALLWSQ